jgi:Tfp pilus assembly protein PilV
MAVNDMNKNAESGFSYVDVMIAIVILMVGILALMSGLAGSAIQARGQSQQMIAKQVASSTMESIMSVKETDSARLGWDAVGNVGSNVVDGVARGVFVSGMNPVLPDAGADEVLGTADDTGTAMNSLQRQIIITDVCDLERPSYNCPTPGTRRVRIRSVQVIVRYFVGSLAREERLTTVLTDYAV